MKDQLKDGQWSKCLIIYIIFYFRYVFTDTVTSLVKLDDNEDVEDNANVTLACGDDYWR